MFYTLKIISRKLSTCKDWSYLKQFDKKYNVVPNMIRHPDVQKKYDLFLKYNNQYQMKNTIEIRYLSHKSYALVPNDFPYFVKDDIKHMILWCKFQTNNKETETILNSLIPIEYIYWQNAYSVQSIPLITHFQVFIKLK